MFCTRLFLKFLWVIPIIKQFSAGLLSLPDCISHKGFYRLQKLTFGKNVTKQMVQLRIFHDKEKSLRRAFSMHIKPDEMGIAGLGLKKTIIYIEEVGRRTGVTFPLKPKVASLKDYDDLKNARVNPIQGYPLICVTVGFSC